MNLRIPFQVIIPQPHAGSMAGTRTRLDLETDTKSPTSSGAVVLVLNEGSHITRSLRPNGPSICTPEGGMGWAPCDEVRLIQVLRSAEVWELPAGRARGRLGSYC